MLTAKELREKLAALIAEVDTIVAVATEEKRELTDEEKTRIDAIQGVEGKPGELDKIKAEEERALKIENLRTVRARELLGAALSVQTPHIAGGDGESLSSRIVVPRNQSVFGKLKAFSGDTAPQDAYVSGLWIAATFYGHKPSRNTLESIGLQNAMSESEDDRGGIFVPVEMERAIIRLVESYGVIRQFSNVVPMSSDRKVQPVRVSGLTATPVAETKRSNEGSNTVAAQDVIWTNIELIARKWKVVCKWSDELDEDSLIRMADAVAVEAALAFAYSEDNCGFNGDATSTYHGINGVLNALAAGSLYTAATGNTAFSTLDLADFEGMAGQLPDYPGITPAWFISKEGYFASMHRLQMAAGGNTASNIEMGGRREFLSYPVVFTNVLNKVLTAQTSTKILAFGDLRLGAMFGDRRSMTMSLTDQRYWDEDQIAVKATERFDFNVHSKGTATEAGAVLVMQTPGS